MRFSPSTFVYLLVVLCASHHVESFAPLASSSSMRTASAEQRPFSLVAASSRPQSEEDSNSNKEPSSPKLNNTKNIWYRIKMRMPSLNLRKVKRSRLVGVTLTTMAWWKGPDAILMTTQQPSSNVAHAAAPAATATAKASKSGGGIRILTGTGTILVATGAGGMVGRKIIKARRKQNDETNASSIDDDDDSNLLETDQPIQQGDLEFTKLKMTDEEQEAAEAAAQEAQEKTQAMVASMLDRVKEAELRASEVLEDATKSEPEPPVPHTPLPSRPVPVPITNDVEPKKSESQPPVPLTPLPSRPVPVPITNDVEPKKNVDSEPAVVVAATAAPSAMATPAVPVGIPAAVPKAAKVETRTPASTQKVPVQSNRGWMPKAKETPANDVEPKKSVEPAPVPTDGVAVEPEVMSPLVEPTSVTSENSKYLPSSDEKEWGLSSTIESTASSSTTDSTSTARAALAETADKADTSGATVTDSTEDLIAKYFVYPSDAAPAVQAKPNVSWKESLTFGAKTRDTSGLKMIASSTQDKSTVVAAPTETKDFDALDLITQQSFLEHIRDESVDMAKARRADENLELSAVESKKPAMAAGTRLDTKVASKKAEKKNQNNKTKQATGETKSANFT